MSLKILVPSVLTLLFLVVLIPQAAAHPAATVLEAANGERCYLYWNDSEIPEYWVETNGYTTGGVPEGTPIDHYVGLGGGGSGLQRSNGGGWGNKDTKLTEDAWLERCLA